jgi:hypothetical protein
MLESVPIAMGYLTVILLHSSRLKLNGVNEETERDRRGNYSKRLEKFGIV